MNADSLRLVSALAALGWLWRRRLAPPPLRQGVTRTRPPGPCTTPRPDHLAADSPVGDVCLGGRQDLLRRRGDDPRRHGLAPSDDKRATDHRRRVAPID
jgi:hypothetical protein